MGTLKYHGHGGLDCRAIKGLGCIYLAGCNTQISPDEYKICKEHPYLASLLEMGVLEYTRGTAEAEEVSLGIPVRTENNEHYPVLDAETRQALGTELPLTTTENNEVKKTKVNNKKAKVFEFPEEELKAAKVIQIND